MPPPFVLTTGNAMPTVWTDWMEGQDTSCFLCTPKDRHELVASMKSAPDLRTLRLRARGSGHSSSDVGAPRAGGFVVDFRRFSLDHAQVAEAWWKQPWQGAAPGALRPDATLVRVAGSMTVASLNQSLRNENPGRALLNLGSYDAQTIAGVISTATHGSGMATGPLSDFVVSIELVSVVKDAAGNPSVKSFRIEPDGGVTDRAKFDAKKDLHGMELVQNDDTFHSAVVGLGCFGIITAVTLQVVPAFSLLEHRKLLSWRDYSEVAFTESNGAYVDFLMTALPREGEHQCLVTSREIVPPSAADASRRGDTRVAALESRWPQHPSRGAMTRYLSTKGSNHPLLANELAYQNGFDDEVKARPPGHELRATSSVVFRTSIGDYVYATSIEVCVPRERVKQAVNQCVLHSAAMHAQGLHHLSPYGVRYVKSSKHYLAPEHERDTCTIEAPILLGARKKNKDESTSPAAVEHMLESFYARFEAWPFPARFHWGQRNFIDYQDAKRTYPKFEGSWLPKMRQYNPFGTFDNAFTDRLGISVP